MTAQQAILFARSGAAAVTTSYANAGGTGDRRGSITMTTTATTGGGLISDMLDGTTNNSYWWVNGESTRVVHIDFGSAKTVDEFKWYQDVGVSNGDWVMEGSNDDSSWTTFPETFTLGTANGPQTIPVTNSTAYRYYRLRQTSGTTTSTAWKREIEFKIA